MNHYVKSLLVNGIRASALAVFLLAGCAPQTTKPDDTDTSELAGEDEETDVVPDKGDPEARFKVALKKLKRGKLKDARKDFFTLSQDFPDYPGPYINLGIIHQKQKRRDQAIGSYSRAQKLDENNVVALNLLALAFQEDKNFERAEKNWKKAIAADSSYTPAMFNLGLMLEDQGRNAEAISYYKQYLAAAKKDDLRVKVWIAELSAKVPQPTATIEGNGE